MSQHEPDDFTQLRGAFDQPIAPSPAFARRLKEEVEMEAARIATTSPEAPGSHPGAAHGTPTGRVLRMNTWPGALMTAATIALVVALGFAALRPVIERNGGPDVDNGNGGFVATPSTPENAQPADEETLLGGFVGTDAGYGLGPMRELSDELTYAQPIEGVPGYIPYSGIFGDVGLSAEAGFGPLRAIDMTNGAVLWSLDIQVRGQIVSDGSRLYLSFANNGTAEYGLAAYDLYTGHRLWYVPDAAAAGFEVYSQGPLVADGVVYMHDDYQTFFAVDAASGDVLWTTTLEHEVQRSIPGDFGQQATLDAPPQMAISGDSLVVMVGQQYLSALNRHDGSLVATTTFRDAFVPGYPDAEFSMRDGIAYVSAYVFVSGNASPAVAETPPGPTDGAITAIRPDTGEILWRSEVESLQSVSVAVGDRLVAVTADGIVSLDRATGTDRIDLPLELGSTNADIVVRTDGDTAWIAVAMDGSVRVARTDGRTILRTWEMAVDGMPLLDTMTAYNGGLLIHSQYAAAYQIAPLVELSAPEVATPATPQDVVFGTPTYEGVELPVPSGSPEAVATFEATSPSDSATPVGSPTADPPTPVASGRASEPPTQLGDITPFTDVTIPDGAGPTLLRQGNIVVQWEMANNDLVARDATTNEVLWATDGHVVGRIQTDGELIYAYMSSVDLKRTGVFAYDLVTGQERWFLADTTTDTYLPQADYLLYDAGTLYLFDGAPAITAIDAKRGAVQWTTPLDPAAKRGLDVVLNMYLRVPVLSMTVSDQHLVVQTGGGFVASLSAASGTIAWHHNLSPEGPIPSYSSMAVHDGVAFVTINQVSEIATPTAQGQSFDSETATIAFDVSSGERRWVAFTVLPDSPLAIDGDRLASFAPGVVYSIDPMTGSSTYVTFDAVPTGNEVSLSILGQALLGSAWFVTEADDGMHITRVASGEVAEYWFVSRQALEGAGGTARPVQLVEWDGGVLVLFEWGSPWFIAPESGTVPNAADPVEMETLQTPSIDLDDASYSNLPTCTTATVAPTATEEPAVEAPTIGAESTNVIVPLEVLSATATADGACASPTVEPTPTIEAEGDISLPTEPLNPTPTGEATVIEGGDNFQESTSTPSPTATVDSVIRPEATEG